MAKLGRCPSLPALSSLLKWQMEAVSPQGEDRIQRHSSPWRSSILLGLALGFLLMEGLFCLRHPQLKHFPGVLARSHSSPVLPIWAVPAVSLWFL